MPSNFYPEYLKEFEEFKQGVLTSRKASLHRVHWSMGGNTGLLGGIESPERITSLEDGEIFVFGSNANGYHGGGAAAFAMDRFGAEWGNGEGLQGQSYAIPTMEGPVRMAAAVHRFCDFAAAHPELKFLVTEIGCGIAGYSVIQVAPMFQEALALPNVMLPKRFWEYFWAVYGQVPDYHQFPKEFMM